MIRDHRSKFRTGVVHSFTGSMDEMKELVMLGLYIGISGRSLKSKANCNVAEAVPLSRLLVETACPYYGMKPKLFEGAPFVATKFPCQPLGAYDPDNPSHKGCIVRTPRADFIRNEPCSLV